MHLRRKEWWQSVFSQTANKQKEAAILVVGVCSPQARPAVPQQDRMGSLVMAGDARVAWEDVSDEECLNSPDQKQLVSTERRRNWEGRLECSLLGQIPERNSVTEERFSLSQGLRSSIHWWLALEFLGRWWDGRS